MTFWQNAEKFAKATGEYIQDQQEQQERRLRSKLRTLTDEQVLRATNNAETQSARNLAYDEARRRGLL